MRHPESSWKLPAVNLQSSLMFISIFSSDELVLVKTSQWSTAGSLSVSIKALKPKEEVGSTPMCLKLSQVLFLELGCFCESTVDFEFLINVVREEEKEKGSRSRGSETGSSASASPGFPDAEVSFSPVSWRWFSDPFRPFQVAVGLKTWKQQLYLLLFMLNSWNNPEGHQLLSVIFRNIVFKWTFTN